MRTEAHRLVFQLFTTSPDLPQQCFDLILTMSSLLLPLPLPYLVTLSLIVICCAKNKGKDDFIGTRYVELIKLFCTGVLGSRACPDYMIVGNCAGLFKKVTREIFTEHLLPAILKALLRNPDELIKSESVFSFGH